jgi:hypothetical protein
MKSATAFAKKPVSAKQSEARRPLKVQPIEAHRSWPKVGNILPAGAAFGRADGFRLPLSPTTFS